MVKLKLQIDARYILNGNCKKTCHFFYGRQL
uniref:Uncharacterized protein n=1 Tax=Anguilla anguilla TaxID=7936 RepID=A0A0E9V7Y2_ANGAN